MLSLVRIALVLLLALALVPSVRASACRGSEVAYILTMTDAYGDGWDGAAFTFNPPEGSVETGTLSNGATGTTTLCLAADDDGVCHPFEVSAGSYPTEVGWSIADGRGQAVASGGAPTTASVCFQPPPADLAAALASAANAHVDGVQPGSGGGYGEFDGAQQHQDQRQRPKTTNHGQDLAALASQRGERTRGRCAAWRRRRVWRVRWWRPRGWEWWREGEPDQEEGQDQRGAAQPDRRLGLRAGTARLRCENPRCVRSKYPPFYALPWPLAVARAATRALAGAAFCVRPEVIYKPAIDRRGTEPTRPRLHSLNLAHAPEHVIMTQGVRDRAFSAMRTRCTHTQPHFILANQTKTGLACRELPY